MMGLLNDGPLIPFRSSHLEIAGQRGPVLAQEFFGHRGNLRPGLFGRRSHFRPGFFGRYSYARTLVDRCRLLGGARYRAASGSDAMECI